MDGNADRADAVALRVNTLISLALAEFLLNGMGAAIVRLGEAERVAQAAGGVVDGEALSARIAYQRANIHGRAGDLTAAWKHLDTAMARLDAFTDRERCSVLLSRGMVALEQSRSQQAADAFAEAARLAHRLGYAEEEFMARHNEGYAVYFVGDLPRALSTMAHADRIESSVSLAPARLHRGKVLLEAGLVTDAIEVLRAGAAECTGRGHAQIRADFNLELARSHLALGQLDAAAEASRQARTTYQRVGAPAWAGRAELVGLKAHLTRLQGVGVTPRPSRRRAAALATAQRADQLALTADRLGDQQLARRSRILAADAQILAGGVMQARERLDAVAPSSTGSLVEELDRVAVEASVLLEEGQGARARRLLARAARTLAAAQRGSASLDVRTARAVHGGRLARLDLDLALARGSGSVLESLERWRSATDRLPSLRRVADEELAGLTEQLRGVHARIRTEQVPGQLDHLQRQAARLQRLIRARDWTLSSGDELTADLPVRLRDARQVLTALGRDLLWFFPYRGRLCGLGITGGRSAVRDLMDLGEAAELARRARTDLRVAATRDPGPLSGAVWGSLRDSALRLDQGLVGPWKPSDRGLVVVTCEQVAALPWALLPSLSGRPLTVARSLTAFARRSEESGAGRSLSDRAPSVHISTGPDVARGLDEAKSVAAAWGAAAVVSSSTSRGLVGALAAPGVVHVAAHGTHVPESPLFSSVALQDGPVFAHELQPSGVAADHVVLSACDVGQATTRPGDESLGLAASMLALGARSVVAAVAPVSDDVAADVMARHHVMLARGLGSDEALAVAIGSAPPVAAAFLNLGGRW